MDSITFRYLESCGVEMIHILLHTGGN